MSLLPTPKLLRVLRRACKLMWPTKNDFRLISAGTGYPCKDIAVLAPYDVPLRLRGASAIINEEGHLLIHTIRSYESQVREAAEADELFAPGVWGKIKQRGAKVVSVEILFKSYE